MFRALFLAGMIGFPTLVVAQDASPPAAEPKAKAPLTGRKAACVASAKQKGLRGDDLKDELAVCIEKAKLGCLEQAVAQKSRGADRKTFMEGCMAKTS